MTNRRTWGAVAALAVLAACSGHDETADDPLAPPSSGAPVVADIPATASGYGEPVLLGTLADPDVQESSGLAASRTNPGRYWTHNDSGDDPFVYCLGGRGERCGVWRVTGAEAIDWEDMAAGPGPAAGTSYLYLGDIGDNTEDRADVVVYRVPEPTVPADGTGPTKASPGRTERAETFRLRYPDGSHNAESLMVHPASGDLYVVTKEPNPGVYVARAPLAATSTMTRVGGLPLSTTGNRSLLSGSDIAPDGRRVALCDYVQGYELRLPPDATSFDAIWQQPPQPLALGSRPQGEAIAYRLDGKALVTTSERPGGLAAPMHQIEQR